MRNRTIYICALFLFTLGFCSPITTPVKANAQHYGSQRSHTSTPTLADFPTVDPNYIYDQLDYMATHFLHRETGYDTGLAANQNGHDEFADYWAQEMTHNLQGFGAQIQRDPFSITGWQGRPATTSAFNLEVSVPGATHPEQIVVIGCHYDGMAFSSQSANDDASGCAIELGVARAMASYWQSHHLYPARTLRFVIFDAEEQGLYGSYHYLNSTINGDTQSITAMFNEEQNGIAYPVRYLGRLTNPLLPFYTELSPLQNSNNYPDQDKLSSTQHTNIQHFRNLMNQAIAPAFQQFQALGYANLTYHDSRKSDKAQPVFSPDQVSNVQMEDDFLGASDQVPFTLAGLPCATFAGNTSYYDKNPPPWSYPYDQPGDTIQLMNTFADGSSHKSNALALALALPGMLTTWMLHRPDILGETLSTALPTGTPLATISDIGQTQAGKSFTINAKGSFDPSNANTPLIYTWDFGDGQHGSGLEVSHTYTVAGNYTLTLTTTSSAGASHMSKTLKVTDQSIVYANPYIKYLSSGRPPSNSQVTLPRSDDTLSDRVIPGPASAGSSSSIKQVTPTPANLPPVAKGPMTPDLLPFSIIAAVLLIVIISITLFLWRKWRT